MKKLLLILLCVPLMFSCGEKDEEKDNTENTEENIIVPDANFKAYLVSNTSLNTNGDTEIQLSEVSSYESTIYCEGLNIADLTGIENFTNLTYLNCDNNQLTSLDVSQNTALTYLSCANNQLTTLDVSNNTALVSFCCKRNQLTSLDVSQNTALFTLSCDKNLLTYLNITNNSSLRHLYCDDNKFDCDALKKKLGLN
ncbi:leucine-rich repeat domain-containing protein [Flavobacteriales bacterium]|nr:leucine-rich repeat domain-containing protein [Flavobacteriales bacterium]